MKGCVENGWIYWAGKSNANSIYFAFFSNALMEEIKVIPAADVAPVIHAHWIRQDESFTRFKCSNPECSAENFSGFENYCPNCGAKMDENWGDFIGWQSTFRNVNRISYNHFYNNRCFNTTYWIGQIRIRKSKTHIQVQAPFR